ncbi:MULTISPECIES: MFS transporter [unclassified Micromonospora]|uniref:MFS transporter n=1 Tax=unclassified Micromonospora TaxID=2617518 RepID=UPI001C24550D|nr:MULTISPECIES: MFS transporter [unclassified Micromonospora]MBU8858618.1 MFS transporter [Micromonospora sp. WMMB482]MDM4784262.1 MFS transporter [Micromonospora sp. b486]
MIESAVDVPARSRRVTGLLLTISATDAVATGVILPTLPFLALDLGVGPVAIGALIAASAVMQLVMGPVWGGLADRFDSRRLLIIAPLIAAAGHLLLALAQNYQMMVAARVLTGAGAAVPVLLQARIVAETTDRDRTAMVGRVTAVQGAGTILGPALGALVVRYGIGAVGMTAALAALLVALLASRLPARELARSTPRRSVLGALRSLLGSRRLRPLVVIALLGWLCFTAYATALPLFLNQEFRLSSTTYGGLIAISGMVALLVRGVLLGWLVKRLGEPALMVVGAGLLAASMALVPLLPTVWLTPLLPLTYAIGAGLLFPCQVARVSSNAPEGTAGLALGGNATVAGLGTVLGPLAAGALFTALAGGAFLLGAAVLVVVATIAVVTEYLPQRGVKTV